MTEKDLAAILDGVAEVLKERDAKLIARMEMTEERVEGIARAVVRIPAGPPGERGERGEPGPQGEPGVTGPQGEPGEKGTDGDVGAVGPPGEAGPPGEHGEPGATGPQGEPGPAGERGERGERGEPGERGERGERGLQGERGEPGRDGASVELATVEALCEAANARNVDRWALDFERRAAELFQRAVDKMPRPRDGRDAFELEDLSVEHDGDGNVTLIFKRDEVEKRFVLRFPRLKDAGVYGPGRAYRDGDVVTFGGSLWVAQKDAPTDKPGVGDGWRLAVKRGKDGRDGIMKTPPQNGPVKLP